ncbi:hypothetical protein Ancab_010647 [Ancistrocladus abbreviatus]
MQRVNKDEFSIYVADEAPFPEERSRAKWYGSEEFSNESSEAALPSIASIRVVPESIGMDITGGHLPVVATSRKSNPEEQILNLGINASIIEAHEEHTRNDEMVSKQFEFHRLSKENVCRMDGGEKLIVSSRDVNDTIYLKLGS